MSLTAPYSEVYLAGDGVSAVFAYGTNFKPVSENYVKCIVYLENGYEVVPTYTVNLGTNSITISSLTLPDGTALTVPPVGSTVRIYRDVPEAQNLTASQLKVLTNVQMETTLDAIVAMIQENTFTTEHKTVRLSEPQRDIALQELKASHDSHLIYWDNTTRKLVVTEYTKDNVVQCVGSLYFKIIVNTPDRPPYLQWSHDKITWYSMDFESIYAVSQEALQKSNQALSKATTALDATVELDRRVTQNEQDIADILAGGNIDNVTIKPNDDDLWEVQAVRNQNTEVSATQPIYDWVGTQQEYAEQNVATLHPDWLCYITDDIASQYSTYVFEQGEAATTWYVTHNLNKYPSVTVVDSAGTTIDCTVIYINSNECELRFNAAFKGVAYLN